MGGEIDLAWRVASDKRLETCGAAHIEHVGHAGHARDVPSKRLVERSCKLPGKARRGGKWEARWILRGGFGQVVQTALRTENIPCMLVTLETSQASGWLNAPPAYCQARNIPSMLVTLETSQASG